MLKAEQIPDAVIDAAVAMRDRGGSMSDIIRTAINAWPGSEPLRRKNGQGKGVFLPLPQETRDE